MNAVTKDRILKEAERYARQGKFDAAISEYQKVTAADPDDLTVANTLGDLYVRQGRTDLAIKHFTRVADRFNASGAQVRAVAMYKKIAKLEPENLELGLQLAELYAKQNLLGEARQQFAAVADAYKRTDRVKEALRVLKRAADIDPGNVRARLVLAESYEEGGYDGEASEVYRAIGQERLRENKLDESIAMFTKALEIKPESRPALKALAEVHAMQGDVKSALGVIARALEVDPNDIDLIIILGRTFLNAGMLEKAEDTFNRLFQLDNSRYDYLLEVGGRYVEKREFDRTLAIIDRCIDVLIARRHKKKATALLKAILERDPGNVLTLKRLAGIYKSVRERRNLINSLNTLVQAALAQGMRSEAALALRQLVEIEPKKTLYQEQLASLSDDTPALVAGAVAGGTTTETGLAVWATDGEAAPEDYDSYGDYSYGDYSTELLEDMVARHPEFLEARLKLLEDLVAQQPAYVEGRTKLKQLYIEAGHHAKAASQCLEIARHHEQQGDAAAAKQFLSEAFSLNPDLKRPSGASGNLAPVKPAPEPDLPEGPTLKLSQMLGVEEFEKLFEQEWRRATREPKPVSLIKISVDRFKSYEEEEGPRKSLHCLELVAAALEAELKQAGQLLASAGNEEFFVLLAGTHPGSASGIADAMRKSVEGLDIPHPNGTKVTISLGAVTAFPYRLSESDALVESIEKALATAQSRGGNRVVTVPLLGS